MSKPDAKSVPTQLKLEWRLTDEQKNQVMRELWDYISIDCYDFTVQIGGLTIRAGEMAELGEGEAPRNEDAFRSGNR